MATSNAVAERQLRLLAEELIAGAPTMVPDEALAGLADVETRALALSGAGVVDGDFAIGLVVAVVDALAVRRVAWLEPAAADLDLARLHEAVGSSRPQLRSVVAVGATLGSSGVVTCVASWDDRTDAHLVAFDGTPAPAIVLEAVGAGDRRLDVRDGGGAVLGVELARGVQGTTTDVMVSTNDVASYLADLEAWVRGEAHRRADDVDALNRLRRQLLGAGDALHGAVGIEAFDALVATLPPPSSTAVIEVVPLAIRAGDRWLLALERWADHWRLRVHGGAGRGRWTAVDGQGRTFGGAPIGDGVVRFDPALPGDPSRLRLSWTADGAAVSEVVEVLA